MELSLMKNICFEKLNPFRVPCPERFVYPRISCGVIQIEPLHGLKNENN